MVVDIYSFKMGDTMVENNNIEHKVQEKRKQVPDEQMQQLTEKVLEECNTLLKNRRRNSEGNELQKAKARTSFSPKSSLDKVAQDIKNILCQLNDTTKNTPKSSTPVHLKIEKKEFFKTQPTKKPKPIKQNTQQKNSIHNTNNNCSSAMLNKMSRNSIKIGGINKKNTSASFTKRGSLNTLHSSQLLRKIPITKSELKHFKHNIILNAKEVINSRDKLTILERQNVAKQVKNLMEAALIESEHTHKVPVIDLKNFINKSLQMTCSEDFPELKKIVENKTKCLHESPTSESEWSEKSCVTTENKICDDTKKDDEKGNKVNRNNVSSNGNAGEKNHNIANVSQSSKIEENKSKDEQQQLFNPVVQTLTTLPHNGYTNRVPRKSNVLVQGQSRASGSFIIRPKSPQAKSIVNKNKIALKSPPKPSGKTLTRKATALTNKQVASKQTSSEKPQNSGNIERVNRASSRLMARSNSILPISNIFISNKPKLMETENAAATLSPRSPSAKSSLASTARSGVVVRRRDSQLESHQRRSLPATPRSFSSVSSRLLSGRRQSQFGMSVSSDSYSSSKPASRTRRCSDPMTQLRDEVNRAIRDKRTFTVRGNYPAVRKALLRRGWVEKYHVSHRERLQQEVNSMKNRSINELVDLMHVKDLNEICKKLIKSKLIGSHQVDLYWGPNLESFQINPDKVKLTKINKFRRDVFSYTSKQGLSDAAKNAHWFNFPGLAHINHPRTYALAKNGETGDFIKDFRRTAAMSLLKWVLKSHETKECKIISNSGKIPLEAFQFAANECYKMVIEADHLDIDNPLKEAYDHEWHKFLEFYYKILHIGNHFKASQLETEATIVEKSSYLVEKLESSHPHMSMDGTMNIWILKPAAGSQGKGIHICRTLQYIMDIVKNNTTVRYIAQKYIERPLLIFNTKFDIRQWFLISCALPLTIWMYKECYLRFSSQTYNLRKLHESIHLTNNCVQQRYQNTSHDITLPNYNMWDSIQFKNYLSNIGYPDIYRQVIYKGMRECIIGAVMIHQDKIDKRKNCFELYGADFMLSEDFQPWLIEINSSPALSSSTPITSRMCPQVLEDTIKVVVDYVTNPNAKTGGFELIYKQPNLQCNNSANISNLKVSGKPLPSGYFCPEQGENAKQKTPISLAENLRLEKQILKSKPEIVSTGVKETLENLLKFIQNEKRKRQKQSTTTKGTDPIKLIVDARTDDEKSSCTTTSLSVSSIKAQLDVLTANGDISISKEDESLIDHTLKMLKTKRNKDVVRYLIRIIERIVNKPELIET